MTRHAFTLIELLVVVAIIATLIAILLPSMSKAVYTAQLATCGSQMHQIDVGIKSYAAGSRGHYPRRSVNLDNANPKRTKLQYKPGAKWDDRPMLEPFVSLRLFQCPLSPTPHADGLEETDARDVHGSYEMYFGSRMVQADASTGLMRLSDPGMIYQGQRFRVLLADHDWDWYGSTPSRFSAHPDLGERIMSQSVASPSATNHYAARWGTAFNTINDRGPIDRNFGYVDGSVRLITATKKVDDPRMVAIPYNAAYPANLERGFLPID